MLSQLSGMHHDAPGYLTFWGKARPHTLAGPRWHPVAHHLLDVAAVANELLLRRSLVLSRIACLLGLTADDTRRLVVALAGLHDLGKFAPAFQAKSPEHWPTPVLGVYREEYAVRRPHTEDGFVLWDDHLAIRLGDRVWNGGESAIMALAPAVFGHHGRPVGSAFTRDPARTRFRAALPEAERCAEEVLSLLSPIAVSSEQPPDGNVRLASWLVSGVITLADWVGSSECWFPYTTARTGADGLREYWALARQRSEFAVRQAGLVPSTPGQPRSFNEMTPGGYAPTPLQQWASTLVIPNGPVLILIEDVTGSGKTEAAQMLVHRLVSAGRATGAYWAMPTMATANAMYSRQASAIDVLYASRGDGEKPSLVLAHGQQRLHEAFRRTVLRKEDDDLEITELKGSDDLELESSVACAAFLADDRRTALLADVGAGTIDQAILAVLPSRFNTMRLFGLAGKVLVIDEAHAYDAYMGVEIEELLRFQAALGGTAVVLSATLSRKQRSKLARAWADGVGGGSRMASFRGGIELASAAYPLATTVSADAAVSEEKLEAAPWSYRRVEVRLVHDVGGAIEHVCAAADRGAAVAWVRNTVDGCLDAAARLRARGVDPLVFHARFAQGDRQAREAEVMRLFGKSVSGDERRGRVLVATQVIEQSLDLDFDAMVSDLAPIDLLVQRSGRLWRHGARSAAGRPSGLAMELVVLSPEPADEPPPGWLGGAFAGTAHVYENAGMLWRTVKTLSSIGSIETPGGLRTLIESVYDSDDVPSSLLPVAQRAEGQQSAHAAAANYGVLKASDGYHADAVSWVSDVRMPTRIGDPRTTVRLARVTPDGGLEPWVSTAGPSWKSWALSEVSVSARRIPPGSSPESRYLAAVARLRTAWGRFEQEIPVVVMELSATPGEWVSAIMLPNGETRRLTYATRDGLTFVRSSAQH